MVSVVYEYDINSNIPAYLWNLPAYANSLLAYFDRRLNQDELYLPVDDEGNPLDAIGNPLPERSCEGTACRVQVGVDDEGEPEYARILVVDDTTYVSYESNRLPLVEPLRLLGEAGDRIADAVEPAMRAVVDYGYPYNDPLATPDEYIPARLIPRRGRPRRSSSSSPTAFERVSRHSTTMHLGHLARPSRGRRARPRS